MKFLTQLSLKIVLAPLLLAAMLILLGGCQLAGVNVSQPTPTPTSATPTPGSQPLTGTIAITTTAAVTTTGTVTDVLVATSTPVLTATQIATSTSAGLATPTATAAITGAITGTATTTGTGNITGAGVLTATGNVTATSSAVGATPAPGVLMTDMSSMTIGQIISTTAGFETLATALDIAGMFPLLDGPGPLTLFAPTNAAFAIYPSATISTLLASPAVLQDVLQYHVIVDSASSAQLAELGGALTYMGELVNITIDANGAYLANDAVIVQADIQAANGIIHVINGLLVPSSADTLLASRVVNPQAETDSNTRPLTLEQLAAADTSTQTIDSIIHSIDGLTTLAAAVDAAGLNDALNTAGPITLLAPTDGAFAELPAGQLETLLNSEPAQLVRTLQYHTILDSVTSADLAQLGTVLTATGDPVTVTVGSDGVITLNGAATVFMADIEASNGIIHVISGVLTPPPAQ
ncbi:MAG: fasciclin domain-containing protein [Caldilineaceae bacterium]